MRREQLGVVGGFLVGDRFGGLLDVVENRFLAIARRRLQLVHAFLDGGDFLFLLLGRQFEDGRCRAAATVDAADLGDAIPVCVKLIVLFLADRIVLVLVTPRAADS